MVASCRRVGARAKRPPQLSRRISEVIKPRDGAGAGGDGATPQARLASALDETIVPRLVLAGRVDGAGRAAVADDPAVDRLTEIVVRRDVEPVYAYLRSLHANGLAVERVFLEVLAPTARRLGRLWLEDRCHFSDVTVGVCRLQQALHRFEAQTSTSEGEGLGRRRILLASAPGEQHGFGLAIVAALFRRAGWDVWAGTGLPPSVVATLVARDRFDVVGISVGSPARLDATARLVRTLRRRSCNRDLGVLVGGAAFAGETVRGVAIGADATALDGRQAVRWATDLSAQRSEGLRRYG